MRRAGGVPTLLGIARDTRDSVEAALSGLDGFDVVLESAGVAVAYSGGCTLEDDTLFSYRRDRHTGRFAGLAWAHSGDGTAADTDG